eukprot:m.341346 g.341346  ORF g.341346 m.341346 type:complete len:1284 (-) comp55763_c0_seq1:77-3928(-)
MDPIAFRNLIIAVAKSLSGREALTLAAFAKLPSSEHSEEGHAVVAALVEHQLITPSKLTFLEKGLLHINREDLLIKLFPSYVARERASSRAAQPSPSVRSAASGSPLPPRRTPSPSPSAVSEQASRSSPPRTESRIGGTIRGLLSGVTSIIRSDHGKDATDSSQRSTQKGSGSTPSDADDTISLAESSSTAQRGKSETSDVTVVSAAEASSTASALGTASLDVRPPRAGAKSARNRLKWMYEFAATGEGKVITSSSRKRDPLDIDGDGFSTTSFLEKTLMESNFENLTDKEQTLSQEIKTLDGEMQTLVYENYNKFISATDTIRTMKSQLDSMTTTMKSLDDTMKGVNSVNTGINQRLCPQRDRIAKLSTARLTLKKLQFLLELPTRLKLCLEQKAYDQAVTYFSKATGTLQRYQSKGSFQGIYDECRGIMADMEKQIIAQTKIPGRSREEFVENIRCLLRLYENQPHIAESADEEAPQIKFARLMLQETVTEFTKDMKQQTSFIEVLKRPPPPIVVIPAPSTDASKKPKEKPAEKPVEKPAERSGPAGLLGNFIPKPSNKLPERSSTPVGLLGSSAPAPAQSKPAEKPAGRPPTPPNTKPADSKPSTTTKADEERAALFETSTTSASGKTTTPELPRKAQPSVVTDAQLTSAKSELFASSKPAPAPAAPAAATTTTDTAAARKPGLVSDAELSSAKSELFGKSATNTSTISGASTQGEGEKPLTPPPAPVPEVDVLAQNFLIQYVVHGNKTTLSHLSDWLHAYRKTFLPKPAKEAKSESRTPRKQSLDSRTPTKASKESGKAAETPRRNSAAHLRSDLADPLLKLGATSIKELVQVYRKTFDLYLSEELEALPADQLIISMIPLLIRTLETLRDGYLLLHRAFDPAAEIDQELYSIVQQVTVSILFEKVKNEVAARVSTYISQLRSKLSENNGLETKPEEINAHFRGLLQVYFDGCDTILKEFVPFCKAKFGKIPFFQEEFPVQLMRVSMLDVLERFFPEIQRHVAFDSVYSTDAKRPRQPFPAADPTSNTFLFVLCLFCVELEQRSLHSLQQKAIHLYPAKVTNTAKDGQRQLFDKRNELKKISQALLSQYVAGTSRDIAAVIANGFAGESDWVHGADPTDVSEYARHVKQIFHDLEDVYVLVVDRSEGMRRYKSQMSIRGGLQTNLMSTIQKLFQEHVVVFSSVEFSSHSILVNIMKRTLREFSENIRKLTFGRGGFNQIEIDVEFFRRYFERLNIDDKTEGIITALLSQVVLSASSRSLDPTPITKAVMERISFGESAL